MTEVRILSYHKIGVPFDLSFCWHDRYAFIKHLDFYQRETLQVKTLTQTISQNNTDYLALVFDDSFSGIYDFRDQFIDREISTTIFAISGFIGRYDRWEISLAGLSFRHLTTKQLRQLSLDGHEIGSHTHTHRALTELNNRDLTQELATSKAIIEDITGNECLSLSLPFGRINQKVIDFAMTAGYQNIVSTTPLNPAQAGLFRARTVYGTDGEWNLKAKLGLNSWQKFEDWKLGLFSQGAGCTIMMQKLLQKVKFRLH